MDKQEALRALDKVIDKLHKCGIDDEYDMAVELRAHLTDPGYVRVPEWLTEMSHQMRTQDNRCTSHPFWQVRCKRTLPTEQGYNEFGYEVCGDDGVVYRSGQPIDVLLEHLIDEHEDWCMAWAEDYHPDEPWQSAMENWWCEDNFEDLPDGLRKVYVQEVEEVVSTHLTEADAMAFIERKQHDYPPLYTYVESAYWAPQLRMLQDWIIGLAATKETSHDGK